MCHKFKPKGLGLQEPLLLNTTESQFHSTEVAVPSLNKLNDIKANELFNELVILGMSTFNIVLQEIMLA